MTRRREWAAEVPDDDDCHVIKEPRAAGGWEESVERESGGS